MTQKKYNLTYFKQYGDECNADFKANEYHSLMELLFDKYVEEWGDYKGRAWCGTCHIEIIEGLITEEMDAEEKRTLSKIGNSTKKSRLACQIPVNEKLNNMVFKMKPNT